MLTLVKIMMKVINMGHEHGTKKKILSPRREQNPWPPRYRLGDLTTKLQETCSELGHFSRFVCEMKYILHTARIRNAGLIPTFISITLVIANHHHHHHQPHHHFLLPKWTIKDQHCTRSSIINIIYRQKISSYLPSSFLTKGGLLT